MIRVPDNGGLGQWYGGGNEKGLNSRDILKVDPVITY